jgi:hypothetical protein
MADYYPLIARAVAGLDNNTGENRRALYERARSALVNQLRGVDPPLEESDITRERLALEDAIRRLEAEAVKRARSEPEPGPQPAPQPTSRAGRPEQPPTAAGGDGRPSLRHQALREFRGTVAEAEGLGEASAVANRSARAAYDDVQGYDSPGYQPSAPARHVPAPAPQARRGVTPPYNAGSQAGTSAPGPAHDGEYDYAGAGDEHYFEPPADENYPDAEPHYAPPPASSAPGGHDDWHGPEPGEPLPHDSHGPLRDYRRMAQMIGVVLVLVIVGGGLLWQRHAIVSAITGTMASLNGKPTGAPKPTGEATTQRKITDRIGSSDNGKTGAANAPAAAVAQKVVLYDEDPSDPKGKRYVGSAVWRTETVSPGPGLAPELAVRADVEIPERGMRMTWSLRRNTDKALPASHTIEIMFTLPADFAEGGIANVPGVLMKQNESARGVPLAGLAVKVTNGYFLIGLSSASIDLQRNIQLLKDRDWFDIPIVYTSGKRGILAVEKGTPGSRAFEEAFRAWGQ